MARLWRGHNIAGTVDAVTVKKPFNTVLRRCDMLEKFKLIETLS